MIERMKKLQFLVFHGDYETFLGKLRSLGVVHVENLGGADDAGALLKGRSDLLQKVNSAISTLQKEKGGVEAQGAPCDAPLEEYEALISRKHALETAIGELKELRAALAPWGEFDPQALEALKENGCPLNFYKCSKSKYDSALEKGNPVFRISEDKTWVYLACAVPLDGMDRCTLPGRRLSEVQAELMALEASAKELTDSLPVFAAGNLTALEQMRTDIMNDIDFEKVRMSASASCEGTLMVLQGWIPQKMLPEARAALDEATCLYQVMDPTPEDDIPIRMTNNRFFSLFEPLTKLYMLPAYGEIDLTPFFAPFFTLFFGLCFGDMGYGLLMIVAMPLFDKLFKLINPDFSKWLVPLFGGATILCGLLTGTAFGFSLYDLDIPFLHKLKDLFYMDNSRMFTLSLIIGCVQILFGMCLKACNQTIQLGFKYALSTIGWIILLVTAATAGLGLASFGSIPVIVLMCVSGVLILFFNSPGKNPLLNLGLGLWDAYNMVTGLLGDVLSYVRLFALGLSGGILASVFNSLAEGMSPKVPVLGFLVTALIFLAGHAINIFMNFLSAIVHPMRLTFVEFFKNSGYTGGGREYKPFAENKQIK